MMIRLSALALFSCLGLSAAVSGCGDDTSSEEPGSGGATGGGSGGGDDDAPGGTTGDGATSGGGDSDTGGGGPGGETGASGGGPGGDTGLGGLGGLSGSGGAASEAFASIGSMVGTLDLDSQNTCEWEGAPSITDVSKFPFGNFAALSSDLFDDGAACGECYRLECVEKIDSWGACSCKPGTSVVVMVADYGHDPTVDHPVFDLMPSTAESILSCSSYDDGSKYNFNATRVDCNHAGDITVQNYEGTTSEWLGFVVSEVAGAGAIDEFYFREEGRTEYYQCARNSNGIATNWVCDPWTDDRDAYLASGAPLSLTEGPYRLPIDIKIVDDAGNATESLDLITNFTVGSQFTMPNF